MYSVHISILKGYTIYMMYSFKTEEKDKTYNLKNFILTVDHLSCHMETEECSQHKQLQKVYGVRIRSLRAQIDALRVKSIVLQIP